MYEGAKPTQQLSYDVVTKKWLPTPRLRTGPDGALDIEIIGATGFEGSPVIVGTTAVEMTFTGTTRSISIQSDQDNTGAIWIGKANVSNTGANAVCRLDPGRAVTIELDDISEAVYAVSDTTAQKVYKFALV